MVKKSPFSIKSPKMKKSLNSSSQRMFIGGSTMSIKKKSPKVKSPKIKSPVSSIPKSKVKSPVSSIPKSKVKSPKIKSPVYSIPKSKKNVSLGASGASGTSSAKSSAKSAVSSSLNKLEEKVKTLYGPNDIFDLPSSEGFIPSQPISKFQIKPKPKIESNKKVCNSKCNILTNQCYIDCINYITTNVSEYEKNPNELVDDLFVMIEPRMNKDVYIQNINTANLYNNMVEYTAQKWTEDDIKTIKTLVKSVKDNIHYKPVKLFLKEVKFYKYYT
jgi:hypothetical protein